MKLLQRRIPAQGIRKAIASALLRKTIVMLLIACVHAPQTASAREPNPSANLDNETAFLVRLTPFIDWPSDAFSSPQSPLVICAVATDSVARRFTGAIRTENVGKRPIRLRIISASDGPDACHILYLGSGSGSPAQIARTIGHRPVLTVSHSKAVETAMIVFTIDHSRVRFDINNAAATSSRLAISSKLLALARNVTPPLPPR